MGLINKLKNILFEEEEVEIPVIEKKENKEPVYKEMPRKETAPVKSSFYDDLEPVIKQEKSMEEQVVQKEEKLTTNTAQVSEREIFKSEKTFNFPAFDEKEFESMSPRQNIRSTNILEHERRKEATKAPVRKEEKPVQKFKPSPIISPVYGILDKNYTPDEITTRVDETPRKLDVDSVRKKAFGELPKEKVEEKEEILITEKTMDDKILEEKLEKARTIDELLKDSSDEVITLDNNEDTLTSDFDSLGNTEELIIPEEEDRQEEINTPPKHEESLEDDTLESDLFDLIDSMYENREDGE